jgi:hypothetical protein
MAENEIPAEHKLPCDFIVGHIRFRKGVKLETVRRAADRWHKAACDAVPVNPVTLDEPLKDITPENLHPEI